jgi:hypothetical protein
MSDERNPAPLSINDCARGHRAAIDRIGIPGMGNWRVQCDESDDCWYGPWADSEAEAVELWNKGMK